MEIGETKTLFILIHCFHFSHRIVYVRKVSEKEAKMKKKTRDDWKNPNVGVSVGGRRTLRFSDIKRSFQLHINYIGCSKTGYEKFLESACLPKISTEHNKHLGSASIQEKQLKAREYAHKHNKSTHTHRHRHTKSEQRKIDQGSPIHTQTHTLRIQLHSTSQCSFLLWYFLLCPL